MDEPKIEDSKLYLKLQRSEMLPDASCLPDIPKLSKSLNFTSDTDEMSINESSSFRRSSFKNSQKPYQTQQEVKRSTKMWNAVHFEPDSSQNWSKSTKCLKKQTSCFAEPTSLKSISKTPNLWGRKRKWYKGNTFKNFWKQNSTVKSKTGCKAKRKRSKKFDYKNHKRSYDNQDYEIDLTLKRTKTQWLKHANCEDDIEVGSPVLRKRSRSMNKPILSLWPPPPWNTTHYLSMIHFENRKLVSMLPSRNRYKVSEDSEIENNQNFDEATPGTWDSMAGKLYKRLVLSIFISTL